LHATIVLRDHPVCAEGLLRVPCIHTGTRAGKTKRETKKKREGNIMHQKDKAKNEMQSIEGY